MQRRVSGGDRVRIRAVFQQQRGHVSMAAVRREHERAHAVRLRLVWIRAGLQQRPGRLDVADSRGEQKCGHTAAQHGVIQLFASRPLRLLADDRLGVHAGARANVGAV